MAGGSDSDFSGDAWRAFFAELAASYPDHVDGIEISISADRVTVRGEVPSVDAKTRIVDRLRQMPGVRDVFDMLVVAAPLAPAHHWDPLSGEPPPETGREKAYERKTSLQGDEGTSIVRHPSIVPQGEAIEGQRLRVMIDLALEPDEATHGDSVTISDLDDDWNSIPVRVEIFCADMIFERGANVGTVIVRRGQPSIAAFVEGTIGKLGGRDLIHFRALFDRNGGHCGDAERAVEIIRQQPSGPATLGRTVGWNVINESRRPPDLTIRILNLKSKDQYAWASVSNWEGGPGRRSGEITVDDSAKTFAADLRSLVVRLQPGQHAAALKGFGEKIWGLTPREFKELYWFLRKRLGASFSIQLVTDDPHIQWELMKPVDPDTKEEADHLMIDHPISRWIGHADGRITQRLPRGAIATFAPTYSNPAQRLPFADAESEWLCREFGAIRCAADRSSFLAILSEGLDQERIAALHFAGHGSFDGPGVNGILMSDDWVARMEVDHSGTKLGQKDGSIVVFNACDVGNTSYSLGVVDGWASVFAERSFRGFVAPLWRVTDRHASEVVKTFMTGLYRQNLPLGEAMRLAREEAADKSPTAFAYVCYGDVLAQVV